MFWGGECSPELVLTPIGRKAPTNRAAKGPGLPNGAIFDVRIASGIPRSSRCGWALLCVKGMGPLKSKLRNKDFLKSFFETWESFYLSMDGQALHLFLAKNSATAFHTIPLRSLRRIHVEPALLDPHHLHTRHGHSSASANSKPHTDNAKLSAIEDRYLVVLSTSANDTIQLKSSLPSPSPVLLCPHHPSLSSSRQVPGPPHERELGPHHRPRSQSASLNRARALAVSL
jgi:hypothetical protein